MNNEIIAAMKSPAPMRSDLGWGEDSASASPARRDANQKVEGRKRSREARLHASDELKLRKRQAAARPGASKSPARVQRGLSRIQSRAAKAARPSRPCSTSSCRTQFSGCV